MIRQLKTSMTHSTMQTGTIGTANKRPIFTYNDLWVDSIDDSLAKNSIGSFNWLVP